MASAGGKSAGPSGPTVVVTAEPSRHRRQLRHYILDPKLQLRFIGLVALVSTALVTLLGWMIWSQRSNASRTISRSLESVDFIAPEQKAAIVQHLTRSDVTVLLRMGLVCAALILVLSAVLLVMTHRAAGPLFIIGQQLDRITGGRLPLVPNLRRSDEFKGFHGKFRRMCDALRQRAEEDMDAYSRFLAACRNAGVDQSGAVGHGLEELERLRREKEESLGG